MTIAQQRYVYYCLRIVISVAPLTSGLSTKAIWRNAGQLWLSSGTGVGLKLPIFFFPTSALTSLNFMLPNTTQNLDNSPPAHLMLEVRVGLKSYGI